MMGGRASLATATLALGTALLPVPGRAEDSPAAAAPEPSEEIEEIVVVGRRPRTATSTLTIPAESFELRPLESGGQMLEAVPGLITAQHTGGGKAEQYFLRGFDADHGTDLAVYFDGVPMNLRSHAHGQGFLDLHFVTHETIERLDAHKGPYFARYGDFATAAAIEYVPHDAFDESFVKVEGGEFDTLRAVAGLSPRSGPFAPGEPAQGFVSFEAYHSDGPFDHDENLWRYSGLARGSVDVGPDLTLSGHALAYYSSWSASGLIPEELVEDDVLDHFGSLDPTEGGRSTRAQAKVQVDWAPVADGLLSAYAYAAYYDLLLYSNFTYFLENDDATGDGIVQEDDDRVYVGGRLEYEHRLDEILQSRLRAGVETRYDDADVRLGTQTRRFSNGCQRSGAADPGEACAHDRVEELSLEPYLEAQLLPLDWIEVSLGLRFAWFRFDGEDRVNASDVDAEDDTIWLPKASVVLSPFSGVGPWPSETGTLRELEIFGNFGIGYHSNDSRSVFEDPGEPNLAEALGGEVGFRTRLFDRVELAVDGWILQLEDELVFVGDEGTTESAGKTIRQGVELVTTLWLTDWLYLRGDLAYTSARLKDGDEPLVQAPRFVAKAATGVRWGSFAAELGLRHLGERYASEDFREPKLSDYTVLDLAGRYRLGFLELGLAVENLTNEGWRSSEFFYESRPIQGGPSSEDFHFTPGNPLNVRGWLTAHF
jgi:outer membrane receptor protein involved in Fe transport